MVKVVAGVSKASLDIRAAARRFANDATSWRARGFAASR